MEGTCPTYWIIFRPQLRKVLREELFSYLFVFVLCFSVATHPWGCDITGDDRDLVQWHVHPSGDDRGAGGSTHTHTSSPRARANGMTVPTATPATHTARGEQRREEGMSRTITLSNAGGKCVKLQPRSSLDPNPDVNLDRPFGHMIDLCLFSSQEELVSFIFTQLYL